MNEEVVKLFQGIDIPKEDLEECGFTKKAFQVYNHIGKLFSVERVFEIGTRRGYSLIAISKDNNVKSILSCDDESYIPETQKVAEMNLRTSGYYQDARFLSMSSHEEALKDILDKEEPFDYIHIDGDHDKPGVILDLELCLPYLKQKGIMVVDDFEYIIDVKEATREFAAKYNLGMVVIQSYRGTAILQRRG